MLEPWFASIISVEDFCGTRQGSQALELQPSRQPPIHTQIGAKFYQQKFQISKIKYNYSGVFSL